ncbi:MAG: ATP-dependent DNA ligase [Gammaproteobacteria bacterium]|nr:MAG: ATP-dependent DNA ligase [Gammaproteobacteria bacterium]
MQAYQVIQGLELVSGKLDKEAIIQETWDAGCDEFFRGARLAYSKLVTFGVKKIPTTDTVGIHMNNHPKFNNLLHDLQKRLLTGNRALDAIQTMADECSPDLWNDWYRRILLKDFRCGTTSTLINNVLKRQKTPEADRAAVPVFSPQLAHPAKKHMKKVVGKKFLDPKLDGVRFLAFLEQDTKTVSFYSRNGIINNNFKHLEVMLESMLDVFPESVMFDGEIVSRNFQELMKQWNRKTNVDTSDAIYAVFDMIPLADFHNGICHTPQSERHEMLTMVDEMFQEESNGKIYVVPKIIVDLDTPEGQKTFKDFNRTTLEAGYEGIMLKDLDAKYYTKRSHGWLKIKPVIAVDLQIVEVNAGEAGKEFEHTMGSLTCEGVDAESGKFIRVNVSGGFSHQLRDEIWNDIPNVLGKMVELEADAITQSQDAVDVFSLRFPQFKCFRPDKD